jgi:hypothetical protein
LGEIKKESQLAKEGEEVLLQSQENASCWFNLSGLGSRAEEG